MAVVVEDGSGVEGANSYVSLADAVSYATARGLTFPASPAGPAEAALIRATAAIDATYRSRFPGQRVSGRDQALEWPRKYAGDAEGNPIAANEIPQEVVNAVCEAAVRELDQPGVMLPDLERGGQIKSIKAGSVAIEYGANATAETVFSLIDRLLAGLIGQETSGLFGSTVRG